MNSPLPKDTLSRLRHHEQKITNASWLREMCSGAADCIEQLQMPPAKVRELAECDEGADSLALIRALSMQVEGQRKHIAALQKDAARYRWLRDSTGNAVMRKLMRICTPDGWDSAVDAAIRKQS